MSARLISRLSILLALTLGGAACGGSPATSTQGETAAQNPSTSAALGSGDSTEPVADGEACSALGQLIDEIENFNGVSFTEPEQLRLAFTSIERAMLGVESSAPNDRVRSQIVDVLSEWRPWSEAFAAVDYEFGALEPDALQELLGDGSAATRFQDGANVVLDYAVTSCGVAQARIDAISGDDSAGAPLQLDDAPLEATGLRLDVTIDGEQFRLDRGFCDVGTDGILVGSFEDDERRVTLIVDTQAAGLGSTISVEAPGSAGGAQIEAEYGDGRGAFRSNRYVGTFTCE